MESNKLRDQLSQKALDRIQQFTWDSVTRMYVSSYRQILQSVTWDKNHNGNS
jgi:hypothetical protein